MKYNKTQREWLRIIDRLENVLDNDVDEENIDWFLVFRSDRWN